MLKKINYLKIQKNLEKEGFAVIKNFLPKYKCEQLLNKTLKKKLIKNDPGNFHQGAQMIYNLQNKDKDFLNLIFNNKINKICKNYFTFGSFKKDKDIYQFDSLHSRILTGKTKSQNFHIDSRICGINPPTHIHFFLYLTNVKKIDGPTQLVPKSHKLNKFPNNKKKIKAKKIIGSSGTLIIINSSIWHGSSKKNTSDQRVILTLSYSRWHLRQSFSVPYSLPKKFERKLNLNQKKILGYFNYPPKDENNRLRMRGKLPILK